MLSELLWRRFSPLEDVQTFLGYFNQITKIQQHVVTYGHEPSPAGYQIQHEALFNLSSSFAMRREKKTYLSLSLSETYDSASQLEEQIRPLYDDVLRVVFDDFDDTLDDAV